MNKLYTKAINILFAITLALISIDSSGQDVSRIIDYPIENVRQVGLQALKDGSVINCFSHSTGDTIEIGLTKINQAGSVVWDKRFYGVKMTDPHTFIVTEDDKIVVTGEARGYPDDGSSQVLFLKLDQSGQVVASQRLGEVVPLWASGARGKCIAETMDHGFIIAGYSNLHSFVAKTDKLGNVLWARSLGKAEVDACIVLQDSTIVVGSSFYNNIYLTKISTEGNLISSKLLTSPAFGDYATLKRFRQFPSGDIAMLIQSSFGISHAIAVCDQNFNVYYSQSLKYYVRDFILDEREELNMLIAKEAEINYVKLSLNENSPNGTKILENSSFKLTYAIPTIHIGPRTEVFALADDGRLTYAVGSAKKILLITTNTEGASCYSNSYLVDPMRTYDIELYITEHEAFEVVDLYNYDLTLTEKEVKVNTQLFCEEVFTSITETDSEDIQIIFDPRFGELEIKNLDGHKEIVVCSSTGQIVYSTDTRRNKIDLASLSTGVYIITIKAVKNIVVRKVYKQ